MHNLKTLEISNNNFYAMILQQENVWFHSKKTTVISQLVCCCWQLHEEKGVKFHFESGIKEFVGRDGAVCEAVLSTGARIPADVAILGVGKAHSLVYTGGAEHNVLNFWSTKWHIFFYRNRLFVYKICIY